MGDLNVNLTALRTFWRELFPAPRSGEHPEIWMDESGEDPFAIASFDLVVNTPQLCTMKIFEMMAWNLTGDTGGFGTSGRVVLCSAQKPVVAGGLTDLTKGYVFSVPTTDRFKTYRGMRKFWLTTTVTGTYRFRISKSRFESMGGF